MHVATSCAGQQIRIQKEPSSLLIPVNEIGIFSCKALCTPNTCLGYWIINDSHTQHKHDYELKGFTFHTQRNSSNDEYTLMLTVNASEAVNNTRMYCEYSGSGDNDNDIAYSMTATLLVISSKCIPLDVY